MCYVEVKNIRSVGELDQNLSVFRCFEVVGECLKSRFQISQKSTSFQILS